jgi:tRNA G18 (ribose-2'-O)-methylase SpoU
MTSGVRGPLVSVADPSDVRLADYRELSDPAARRARDDDRAIFIVEGRIAVGRLLNSKYQVLSLLIDDHQAGVMTDLVDGVRATGSPVYVGSRAVVEATVGFALHRGVVASAHRPGDADAASTLAEATHRPSVNGGPPMVCVLEGVNDHQNLGAIFRNAAAFGVGCVLLDPTSADPLYRRSIRVSVGHVLHVPYARLAPWPAALDQVRAAGFTVVGLSPERAVSAGGHPPSCSLRQLPSVLAERGPAGTSEPSGSTPVALVLGAEGSGLSDRALGGCDLVASIPMAPAVDSLNVATAGAIALAWLSTVAT